MIIGKQLTAVLYRVQNSLDPSIFSYKLYWTDIDWGRPDQIAAYYPDLSWDIDQRTSLNVIFNFFGGTPITVWESNYGYAGHEAAVLDRQNYLENIVSPAGGEIAPAGSYIIDFKNGIWVPIGASVQDAVPGGSFATENVSCSGDPDNLWAQFPDANTYNVTVPTPFGDFGNGTIYDQAVYWRAGENDRVPHGALWSDIPYTQTPGGNTGPITVNGFEITYIWTPIDDGAGDTGDTGGGESGDIPSGDSTSGTPLINAWGFSLDDHDYYVLPGLGLVYDLKTNQWSNWLNEGLTRLRACVGQNWVGMTATLNSFGSDIVAGDDTTGVLWIFDPDVTLDDRTDTGSEAYSRVVTSMIALNGREVIPCNAVQLTVALGAPSHDGASITLETSDDRGKTWLNHGSQVIIAADYEQVVEWRGLGIIRQPGRIFRFTDDGATVSYLRAEMR
jgi:hypothetical protein